MKFIVGYPKAVAVLLDPDKTFNDALEVGESLSREKSRAGEAIADVMAEINRALSKIDVLTVKRISKSDLKVISVVIARLEQLKKIYK